MAQHRLLNITSLSVLSGHLEKDVIHGKFPWVTHGKELRHLPLGLLMG